MQYDKFYKPSEAARFLGCDPATVIRYIHSQQLDALTTHTGRYHIPESAIQKYLLECKNRTEQLEFNFN